MPLNLDLKASAAKIARARIHFETLKREILAVLDQRKPYTVRIGEIDPNSGWCSIFLTPGNFTEHGLGLIVGDLVHNLRCALDYIVTALVDASDATVGNKHQFPIFTDRTHYAKRVGTASSANPNGPLSGVTPGLKEIWDLQPFNRKPDPEEDLLFIVHRFSNADKHRIIAEYMPLPNAGNARIHHDGTVLEQISLPLPDWEADREYEVARLRFAAPYPTKVGYEADISVAIHFATPAFGKYALGHAINVDVLEEMCRHVAMIADRFKAGI